MTGLTYRNRDEERDDRQQQERLLVVLEATPSQLRRDECGWWIIGGRCGTIHTWGDGKTWLVYVTCRSARHWTATRRRLRFMTVTQDGDDEGCLRLFRLPTPEEAAVIRDALGLRKRRTLTEESRTRLIAAGVNGRFQVRRAAREPGSIPDAAPTPARAKIASIASINAADTLERKRASMAKAGSARGAAGAPMPDGAQMPPEVNGRFQPEGGLPVEGEAIPEVEEELA